MGGPIKIKATVVSIKPYAEDIFYVTFLPEKKHPPFKLGQFLQLALDEYDPSNGFWPESRAFSIASRPDEETISILYGVKGVFTTRMLRELAVGRTVWLMLPLGIFTIPLDANDVVLIAGGTGIAPFLPFLEHELHKPLPRKILCVYGIRSYELFLAKSLLERCCKTLLYCKVMLFVQNDGESIQDEWLSVSSGIIDYETVFQQASQLDNPKFLLSGPHGMIVMARDFLLHRGIEDSNILSDDWG